MGGWGEAQQNAAISRPRSYIPKYFLPGFFHPTNVEAFSATQLRPLLHPHVIINYLVYLFQNILIQKFKSLILSIIHILCASPLHSYILGKTDKLGLSWDNLG